MKDDDTIDSNDNNDNNNRQYKYKWSTSIEMLHFEFDGDDDHVSNDHGLMPLLRNKLTHQRVKTAYKNLKAFSIGIQRHNLTDYACDIILNNLAFQLKSLHLNLSSTYQVELHGVDVGLKALENWKFISNKYPCTKEAFNCTWYPRNIEHLCLGRGISSLIQSITSSMFPKLKHLKISISNDCQLQNLKSFIYNGLQSLHCTHLRDTNSLWSIVAQN